MFATPALSYYIWIENAAADLRKVFIGIHVGKHSHSADPSD